MAPAKSLRIVKSKKVEQGQTSQTCRMCNESYEELSEHMKSCKRKELVGGDPILFSIINNSVASNSIRALVAPNSNQLDLFQPYFAGSDTSANESEQGDKVNTRHHKTTSVEAVLSTVTNSANLTRLVQNKTSENDNQIANDQVQICVKNMNLLKKSDSPIEDNLATPASAIPEPVCSTSKEIVTTSINPIKAKLNKLPKPNNLTLLSPRFKRNLRPRISAASGTERVKVAPKSKSVVVAVAAAPKISELPPSLLEDVVCRPVLKIRSKKQYKCPKCTRIFLSPVTLTNHCSKRHKFTTFRIEGANEQMAGKRVQSCQNMCFGCLEMLLDMAAFNAHCDANTCDRSPDSVERRQRELQKCPTSDVQLQNEITKMRLEDAKRVDHDLEVVNEAQPVYKTRFLEALEIRPMDKLAAESARQWQDNFKNGNTVVLITPEFSRKIPDSSAKNPVNTKVLIAPESSSKPRADTTALITSKFSKTPRLITKVLITPEPSREGSSDLEPKAKCRFLVE